MPSNLKNRLNWKNGIYKDDFKNGKTNHHYLQVQYAISEVSVVISRRRKLSDPNANSKIYWSILK